MAKSLTYFFAAVILVGGAKLIEVFFYEALKPHHPDDKAYKGEKATDAPKKDKLENLIQTTDSPADSTVQVNEEPENATSEFSDPPSLTDAVEVETQDSQQSAAVAAQSFTGDDYFQNLKNSYLSPILASLPEGRSREDVVIRYYKHVNDGDKVFVLRKLGYYLHEREAEDNKGLGSNALIYGADVDPRDIKLVAYTLIKSGVSLKTIKQSAYDWKFHSLEIGVDSLAQKNDVLSLSDIQTFESR
ncbi:MAG: hypothetical protein ABJG78_21580 [Cyclobacteriaceae bacterium]